MESVCQYDSILSTLCVYCIVPTSITQAYLYVAMVYSCFITLTLKEKQTCLFTKPSPQAHAHLIKEDPHKKLYTTYNNKARMFVPLVLVGLMAAPYCSEGSIVLQPSDPLSHADKVLLLTQRLQQALFANNSSQTIPSMREVFFPSSKYRYWQADNIGIIDIKVCINFQAEDSQEEKETSLNSVHIRSQCLRFRWTNSYFLNLVDIRQMTYFEFLTAGALFGIIAHGRKDRQIRLTFDMTPNESISSIEDTTTKQALIQFLSWVSCSSCNFAEMCFEVSSM